MDEIGTELNSNSTRLFHSLQSTSAFTARPVTNFVVPFFFCVFVYFFVSTRVFALSIFFSTLIRRRSACFPFYLSTCSPHRIILRSDHTPFSSLCQLSFTNLIAIFHFPVDYISILLYDNYRNWSKKIQVGD